LGTPGTVVSNIVFSTVNGYFPGVITTNGTVVPIPEVGSYVYGGLLAGLAAFRHRRKIKDWLHLAPNPNNS
jgi:hypothetical protein